MGMGIESMVVLHKYLNVIVGPLILIKNELISLFFPYY